jgi:hypothetical protein
MKGLILAVRPEGDHHRKMKPRSSEALYFENSQKIVIQDILHSTPRILFSGSLNQTNLSYPEVPHIINS